MGIKDFMDEIKKITQPYDEENDFFEGADPRYKPQEQTPVQAQSTQTVSKEQALFENSFSDSAGTVTQPQQQQVRQQPQQQQARQARRNPLQKQPAARQQTQAPAQAQPEGSLFGNFGKKQQQPKQGRVNFGGRESQVILFSPRTFDEAGDIVNHIRANRSVVMTLEGLPSDTARRLLDFISGIAYALGGKITPVSAKTYFVTPQNVDILGAQDAPAMGTDDENYY